MTDVLDRRATTPGPSDDLAVAAAPSEFDPALSVRIFLAAASAAAGVIHLVMVPSHWGESTVDGLGFAVAGWLQLAIAGLVLVRPTALALKAGIVINAAAFGAWLYSRTAGFPWGAQNGVAEDVGFVDATAAALAAVFVVGAIVAMTRPKLGTRHVHGGLVTAIVATVGIFALTTSALAAPSTREHGGASHHDATAAGGGAVSEGHDHGTPGAADDKGFSLLSNGQHDHSMVQHELDAATQAELERQLQITRDVASLTPTVAAAEQAGYKRVGPYFPGIGAHYWKGVSGDIGSGARWNPDGVIDDVDLNNPLMLIFDGTEQTSKIAGFMYYSFAKTEPPGFAGRNDTWHYHENLCLKGALGGGEIDVPFGLDNSVSKEMCESVGGMLLPLSNYMVHVWSVPGYEMLPEDGGVFGEQNRKLTCADGTYYQLPIEQWADHPMNVCLAQ